ncbi:flavodoxin-dependent (E)-4-hydroxy-3-methylbut-2-enyl-diphosphate synthase, partial [Rhodococcus hoagii]|nr:flavodoxin-dependent (E)-4-hydroxy-3-methylbut-2-enyl-diphosphate synthase [Prescottella equi]
GLPGHHQVATAFGYLLGQGIGDTIRVSLSAPPVEEVKVGLQILQSLNLRERKLEIVSCPSCGRAQVDVYTLAEQSPRASRTSRSRCGWPSWAASSTGRARPRGDLGVASGNGKGQIFVKGEVIRTVARGPDRETLIEEANRIAGEMDLGEDGGDQAAAGAPVVSVH